MSRDETVYRLGNRGKARKTLIQPQCPSSAAVVRECAKNGFGAAKHFAIGINELHRPLIMLVRDFGELLRNFARGNKVDMFLRRLLPARNPETTEIAIGVVNHKRSNRRIVHSHFSYQSPQNHP